MTRFGLLPRRTSRPSINPCRAKWSRMTVAIEDGARVDSNTMTGMFPTGFFFSAVAMPVRASKSGP